MTTSVTNTLDEAQKFRHWFHGAAPKMPRRATSFFCRTAKDVHTAESGTNRGTPRLFLSRFLLATEKSLNAWWSIQLPNLMEVWMKPVMWKKYTNCEWKIVEIQRFHLVQGMILQRTARNFWHSKWRSITFRNSVKMVVPSKNPRQLCFRPHFSMTYGV